MRPRVSALLAWLIAGCSPTPAAELAKPPELELAGQATCKVKKSQLRPLLVEWSSADRAELEARVQRGLVVVRYGGCEMTVLPRCHATEAAYRYIGLTRKVDRLAILNEDQLWANMPIGAAGLEGALKRSGELDVTMTIVGQYESSLTELSEDDLEGHCEGATHVLASLTVGAFELATGTRAQMGASAEVMGAGAGAERRAARATLSADGRVEACTLASREDERPPAECGALIRVEALPLGRPRARVPHCPGGSHWDGEQCVRERVVTRVSCPPGTHLEAAGCVPGEREGDEAGGADRCPADMVFVPAGSFALSGDASQAGTLAEVGDLCIDRTEVTAGAYLECVDAGDCDKAGAKKGCWVTELTDPRTGHYVRVPTTAENSALHDHPINCITPQQAAAYCSWTGKRLPTEAEWEWAARGGPLGRRYTWGDAEPRRQACWQRPRKGTCEVGSRSGDRTAHGVLDMAGNVGEWTSTFRGRLPSDPRR